MNTKIIWGATDATLKKTCPFCNTENEIHLPPNDLARWLAGELIQNVMWYLSPDKREFVISGICIDCQNKIFGQGE